jgi:hypothetical protein
MVDGKPTIVDLFAEPEVSILGSKHDSRSIDEIYVLRKQKNVDRSVRLDPTWGWVKNPIDREPVWELFTQVRKIWKALGGIQQRGSLKAD